MKFLNDSEFGTLLETLNALRGQRDSLLLRTSIYTGARGVEVLRITKADLRDGCISIQAAKGSNNRAVPVPRDFFKELVEFAQNFQDGERIFPIETRQLRRIWDFYRPHRAVGEWKSGQAKGIGAHGIRHTTAILHYKRNRDMHATKSLLGHKALSSTNVYVDFVESAEHLRSTMRGVFNTKKAA